MTRPVSALALVLALASPLAGQAPDLFYELDGEGPTIVFLADWAQDTSIWFRVLPRLRPDFRLLRYDLRGQGRSGAPADGDYSIVAHREDLVRVLDGLAIDRAHLVGVGLGGAIALSFAVERPERVLSVAAIRPHIGWSAEDHAWWERFLVGYDRYGRPSLADYTDVLVARWFGTRFPGREPWIVPFSDLMLRRQPSEALVGSLQAWLGTELSLGGAVPVPVMLLWGERAGPPAGEPRIHRSLLVARRVPVAGAGLAPHVEAPEAVAAELRGFFSGVVSGRPSPPTMAGMYREAAVEP